MKKIFSYMKNSEIKKGAKNFHERAERINELKTPLFTQIKDSLGKGVKGYSALKKFSDVDKLKFNYRDLQLPIKTHLETEIDNFFKGVDDLNSEETVEKIKKISNYLELILKAASIMLPLYASVKAIPSDNVWGKTDIVSPFNQVIGIFRTVDIRSPQYGFLPELVKVVEASYEEIKKNSITVEKSPDNTYTRAISNLKKLAAEREEANISMISLYSVQSTEIIEVPEKPEVTIVSSPLLGRNVLG